MPYAEPTSPLPSPRNELGSSTSHRKAFADLAAHIEDVAGPSHANGPMMGIPRRSSSTSNSAASTPRRGLSPSVSRQPSGSHSHFAATKPLENLPRRQSQDTSPELAGLPSLVESLHGSSLGLKLHPSPIRERGGRTVKDSMDSTSTVESSLPPTPGDEHSELPLLKANGEAGPAFSIPAFQPPPKSIPHHLPRLSSPVRPSLHSTRRGSGSGGHNRGSAHHSSLQLELPVSASTPHLPHSPSVTPGGSATYLRPSHQTIRKKSGEIVRPSLKMRSMSTPDLTRQSHTSEPPTPDSESGRTFPEERSKSVRFANEDDGDIALENVVVFSREQRPTAVGRAADPNGTGQMTETETENDTDASDFVQFRTRRNAAAKAIDEVEKIVMEFGEGTRVPRVRVDFAPDARGSLIYENVVLERADLSAPGQGPLTLRGSAIVRNVSFQKWVVFRFTLDQWQTTSEVSGVHVCHIPSATTGDEGWDRFSFSIKLEDYKRKLDERTLMLCIRFSVDGHEWWDSNEGRNYTFTFRKQMPKRVTRAAYGTFARSSDDSDLPLPGLKTGRTSTSAAQIQKQFAKATDSPPPTAAKTWTFPRLASQIHGHGAARSASPVPSAPPSAAFKAPPAPDAHSHLSLSKYCAPSPPTSPPRAEKPFSALFNDGNSTPKGSPSVELPPMVSPAVEKMNLMGGNYASLAPPTPPAGEPDRIMWSSQSGSFESFAQVLENLDHPQTPTTPKASDGGSTPVALGSRSPAVSNASTDSPSPVVRSLAKRPSTGNLQALAAEGADLLTPPSSNLSSPPSPGPAGLPGSVSPSVTSSTGESSPINTVGSSSTNDLSKLDYQAFIEKFCFFQSPRATPNELDSHFTRPSRMTLSGNGSGYSSPHEFPFYTNSSNSPRATPTPTREYTTAGEAFGFGTPNSTKGDKGNTPKASPMGSPRPLDSPAHPAQALKSLNRAQVA